MRPISLRPVPGFPPRVSAVALISVFRPDSAGCVMLYLPESGVVAGLGGPRKLCILRTASWVGGGVTPALNALAPATPLSRVKLLMLEEGEGRGGRVALGNVVRVRLAGDFLRDVLEVVRELSTCGRVKAVISDCSPYQAVVALTASVVMYEKVTELSVECRSTPQEVCLANAALPHALGGREGRVTKLKLLAMTAGRCVPIAELASGLGLSTETVLRHAHALATAGLTNVEALDGNPVVCGEAGPEAAAIAQAITTLHKGLEEPLLK